MTGALAFVHKFESASGPARAPILLLHGTGGDESDLLPLGRAIAPRAALLSPRGKVIENGMPRFFRRLREGIFDEEDVRRRANELADFVGEARGAYGLAKPVAVGFSNGANIAAAVLLLGLETLAGAVLMSNGAVSQSSGVQACRNARSHPLGTSRSDCSRRKRCAARSGPDGLRRPCSAQNAVCGSRHNGRGPSARDGFFGHAVIGARPAARARSSGGDQIAH